MILRGRSAALAVATIALVSAGVILLSSPLAWAQSARSETYAFAFRDAEIAQIAEEILGSGLGVTYTIDPSVSGKMSFRIERRMTRAQLLESFEAALANNGVVIIRQGDSLLLTTRAGARSAVGIRSAPSETGRGGYEVVAAPLSHATPSEIAKVLQSIGPANVVVHVDDKAGVLLIGGTPREIEAALETIRTFDRGGMDGAKMRWFELSQASAPVVARELNQVLQASGATGSSVVPLRRLNGLIAFARSPGGLEEIAEWVAKLDRTAGDQAASLWVYRPRNVSAESLGATLSSVLPGSAPLASVSGAAGAPAPAAPMVGGDSDDSVRVGIDKESNTLLISASPAQRVQIQKILEEIDVTPTQVLIEASILEVTLNDDFRLGVNWSVLGEGGKLKVLSTGDAGGGVAPTLPGLAITFLDGDVKAAIDILGSKTEVEVVSAPRIVALNNRTATLQIGDQVPVVVQTSQTNTAPDAPRVVNVEYRDTGVILTVTPRVSGEDSIILSVTQEVSAVAKTTTSGIDSPTIQQRRMESTLVLQDGGTVALGGLISSSRSRGDSGVPLLKEVPLLGSLFKSETRDSRRTELIVLLTARIMRSDEATQRVMADILADMKEIEIRGLLSQKE